MQADFGRLIRICRPMVSREAVGKAPDRHPHLDFPALDIGGGQRVARYRVRKFLLDNDMRPVRRARSEEHTSELQSLRRTPYAVFCLKKTQTTKITHN